MKEVSGQLVTPQNTLTIPHAAHKPIGSPNTGAKKLPRVAPTKSVGIRVDSRNSKTLVPKYNKTYTLELKGSGTSTVVIQLDGQAYREYSVDFASASVTTTASHDYVRATTAPPETEPPTQYYTDPYVAPDTTVQPVTDDPEL